MSKVWRILSIDGGGIRGIIPATILASIEERTGKHISQLFDLIAGTSTGGILSLGLTKPNSLGLPEFTAERLCELYAQNIPHIFGNPRSWWGNLLSPKYRSFAFQEVLKEAFSDSRLKNCLVDVMIPCYDIEHRLPYCFKSKLAKVDAQFDFAVRDVALAASASPTMFHPVSFARSNDGRPICLVDGGVFANNPTVNAFAEAKSLNLEGGDKYLVVSIGTGKSTRPLSDELISLWGYVQWSRPMLELVLESNSESVHEQMIHLLAGSEGQESYYRIQINLPDDSNHAIDDASADNMKSIVEASKHFCMHEGTSRLNQLSDLLLKLSNHEDRHSRHEFSVQI